MARNCAGEVTPVRWTCEQAAPRDARLLAAAKQADRSPHQLGPVPVAAGGHCLRCKALQIGG